MTIKHFAIIAAAALMCSACATSSGTIETASVVRHPKSKPVKRPVVERATVVPVAVTPVAVTPAAVSQASTSTAPAPAVPEADKSGYCARWWTHRANGTLPGHVKAANDVAHNDDYCKDMR